MSKKPIDADAILKHAKLLVHEHAHEIQAYGHLVNLPIALFEHRRRPTTSPKPR